MLALSRKARIHNDRNDIEITVLEIKGDQVEIGIMLPNLPIYRKRFTCRY